MPLWLFSLASAAVPCLPPLLVNRSLRGYEGTRAQAYKFLEGAWDIDDHFRSTPLRNNLPVMLGMLSLWNVSFLGYPSRAILPYTQALAKLAPHIQQVRGVRRWPIPVEAPTSGGLSVIRDAARTRGYKQSQSHTHPGRSHRERRRVR